MPQRWTCGLPISSMGGGNRVSVKFPRDYLPTVPVKRRNYNAEFGEELRKTGPSFNALPLEAWADQNVR